MVARQREVGLAQGAHCMVRPGVQYYYYDNKCCIDLPQGYVLPSVTVQSLAIVRHDLCSGSPHVEAVRRVAAAAGPGCDVAASMPQPETLLEKSSSLALQ